MKSTLSRIAAALVFTSLFAAGAQAAAPDAAGDAVRITAPAAYHLAPQEFQDYLNAYALSNGDSMKFSQRLNRYYTTVKGESRVEIFAVAPGVFVTKNGATLKFSEDGEALAIDNYERMRVTAVLPTNTIVTARR
ncbi:hypothetical protein [Duganella aceris]|jgi:NAD(P)-dependent dehydrogenase (short-subunit alcohol dehydrogenase family)|uniref:Gel scht n=1 Tax=Duganella aceris TaxID=2703883 RepID=A0ABX0FE09_9BURK|nr:hypothetical protein [Duganella aceris]NGZ82763.1 hypothetical protein [Duganella aceris]